MGPQRRRPTLLAVLAGVAAMSHASGATDAATTTTRSPDACLTTLESLRACVAEAGALREDAGAAEAAATACVKSALASGGLDGCLDSLPAVLEASTAADAEASFPWNLIESITGGGGDHKGGDDDPPASSACRAALQAASQTTAGMEAVLASGRAALTLGVMGKLLQEMNTTGVPATYLFYQHVQSLGSPDNCKAIPGFQYCWATIDVLPFAKAGVCVPQECSLDDLRALVQEVGDRTGNDALAELDLSHVTGQCGDYRFKALPGTYAMLTLVALLALLVAGGTYLDYRRLCAKEDEQDAMASRGYARLEEEGGEERDRKGPATTAAAAAANGHGSGGGNGRSSEEKDALLDHDVEKATPTTNGHGQQQRKAAANAGLGPRILGCFSLYRTLPSLLGPARPGDFNSLDGVRVFSMSWVVLGHIYAFPATLQGFTNEDDILPPDGILGTYAGQAIFAAEFAVDTFFVLGSFIASFMLAQHLAKALRPPQSVSQPKKPLGWAWVPMLYLHRYLRLTPLYFFVLGMYYYVMRLVDSGPFWGLLQRDYSLCAQYWWTNALYINTLVPWTATLDMCYPVSWYMAVDFQLFLLVPFLVLAYALNKRVGYLLPSLLFVGSVGYAYLLAYEYGTSQFAMTTDITDANRYQRDFYFKAWCRASVYMVGILFAFAWTDYKALRDSGADHWLANVFTSNRRRRLTAPIAAIFGASFVLLGVTAYGAQPAYHPPGLAKFWDASYLALSRPAWVVGLLLLCFLMFQGYGGPIRALLENRVMSVLSRLTFAAYLIHPAVIFLVYLDQPLPVHYSTVWISFNFLGMLTTVFLFSAVAHLLVEKPLANLERVLLSGGAAKKGK